MAVACTHLTTPILDSTANNGASVAFTTPSWTPVAGRGYLVAIKSTGAATVNDPSVTGNGQTWTKVGSRAGTRFLGLWKVDNAASPSAGALSVTFVEATTGCSIKITEVTGHNTASMTTNVTQANNTTGTSGSITMGAFASTDDGTFATFEIVSNEAMTATGGMTALANSGYATPTSRLLTEWATTNISTPGASWTTAGAWAGIGCEVVAAAVAGVPNNRRSRMPQLLAQ